ncbi:urease accessory protein UreF [Pseudalkalibacillus hwajinpoensis]|uniref:urease accessory protein UreF n=1 Tax=Guptibacillus hwajinpoensis TaxID=208199 RepID=UPI001CD2E9EF|nr:urease accessory protein UreF [Pseudalkalibacillus hwajinpoensis]MCA0992787.1 urease accessory protein UreF [Pseudalkalibacillus hwajinpoensis]
MLQMSDSQFPSGAFSHSFGIETYISNGTVHDAPSFQHVLELFLMNQLVYTDGLACRFAYEWLESGKVDQLWELDQSLYALGMARETREGNRRIGDRLVKVVSTLYPNFIFEQYLDELKEKNVYGHGALVFAIVSHHLGIDVETAVSCYGFATASSLVQNAVRGVPLGQTDGQRILVEIQPLLTKSVEKIMSLDESDFGIGSPGLEIAQMQHETINVRLFMS